jgi:hypothetical protein
MHERLIFVSCGQQSTDEKQLGSLAKHIVDSVPGYKAYFAEYVQSLDSLAASILNGLMTCSAMIAFLHDRGLVSHSNGDEWGHRSSVWVNQEIAILAYRKQFETADIPILAFQDPIVKLEGAMTSLIVNPKPIGTDADLEDEIKSWIEQIQANPTGLADRARFESKWSRLSPKTILVLTALLDEGGVNVKESAIRICLIEKYQIDKNEASHMVSESRSYFQTTDLVKLIPNIHSGDEMSLNPVWKWQLIRQIRSNNTNPTAS